MLKDTYAREYDLKLTEDAIMMIICFETLFAESVKKQMVGRGSRSFGVGVASIFLTRLKLFQQINRQLRAFKHKCYNGHLFLRDFYGAYNMIGANTQGKIRRAYENN